MQSSGSSGSQSRIAAAAAGSPSGAASVANSSASASASGRLLPGVQGVVVVGQDPLPSSLQVPDDSIFPQLADELTFTADRKAETQQALMDELLAALRKEEKLLDADSWKYAAPRSRRPFLS